MFDIVFIHDAIMVHDHRSRFASSVRNRLYPLQAWQRGENVEKQKIRLTREKETLLVPLYSKAVASQGPHPIIVDPKAEEILQRIEYDADNLARCARRLSAGRSAAAQSCMTIS